MISSIRRNESPDGYHRGAPPSGGAATGACRAKPPAAGVGETGETASEPRPGPHGRHVIDLHTHILPDIDDGAPDGGVAVAMARRWASKGVLTVVATPHVSRRHPNTASAIAAGVTRLRQELAAHGIELDVQTGAEVAIDVLPDLEESELPALGLGGGPYLLVESPLSTAAGDVEPVLDFLGRRGMRAVLAHAERCPSFQRSPERLARLVLGGALVSIDAGSLSGRFGSTARRAAIAMFERGLVHNVASDAHNLANRPPELLEPIVRLDRVLPGLRALAPWLTDEVPAAILRGAPVRVPPRIMRSRRWGPRRAG